MLRLALSSQKYCGITPYYGSPTYHYLCMGMGMSVSPQIWQQFVDLVFQDNLIKHKQNFDIIMDDTFIHSTAEEHIDDLIDLFKVLRKYGLKLSPHKCQFSRKRYMGLEFQIQEDKLCYTPLKDKCDATKNLEHQRLLDKVELFVEWSIFYHLFAKNFLPVSLFLGYSVAACICCPKCALVLGNGSERFCASRPLLGSYVHQESMLNKM